MIAFSRALTAPSTVATRLATVDGAAQIPCLGVQASPYLGRVDIDKVGEMLIDT